MKTVQAWRTVNKQITWELSVHIYIHVQIWSLVDTSYMKLSRLPTKLRLTGTEYYR